MKKGKKAVYFKRIAAVAISFLLAMMVGCAATGSKTGEQSSMAESVQPMVIQKGVSCGKCGMFPADYPRWQSQIIFKDGSMTPFDGCKCMFNFMQAVGQYDKNHSKDDIAAVLVKDFNNGEWLNGSEAHFVVGSSMMGPMGKELIPFADQSAAMQFHQEHGGSMMTYAEITPEVLKSLMGGMKHMQGSKHMNM